MCDILTGFNTDALTGLQFTESLYLKELMLMSGGISSKQEMTHAANFCPLSVCAVQLEFMGDLVFKLLFQIIPQSIYDFSKV